MSHTFYFGSVAKKKNSTLQPSLSASYDVLFKSPTSIYAPTITLNASNFNYNYAKWGNMYYFVKDAVARNNGLFEVTLELDPMATAKAEILASTQYVCYSNVSGGQWLADTRIPVLKSTVASKATAATSLFTTTGTYILSVVGKDSAASYRFVSTSVITDIIGQISSWKDDAYDEITDLIDGTDTDTLLESLSKVIANSSLIGNAYSQAPNCIRSCIWVPFNYSNAPSDGSDIIYLGNFNTGKTGFRIKSDPYVNTTSVSIPWHFSDWRRGYCEDVYLYLPLVGIVSLSSASLTNVSSISVKYSATYTDGCVSYEVYAGNEIIGTYGANCASNYPIGINQQASAGEVVTSFVQGAQKMLSAGIVSTVSPISMGAAVAGMAFNGVAAAYDVANTASSSHATCVGGIGGGSGSGLDLTIACYTVAHNTVVEPSVMQATMGLPTMKPLTLSSCSGYCQCANAHVAASLPADYLAIVDNYLNSGFYIE